MVNREILERLEEWKRENYPSLINRELNVNIGSDIVAIVGPRRAGKTYFMFQKMKELGQKELYLDFEDVVYRNYKPGDIINGYIEIFGREPGYLFFDEIQNLKDWGAWLRTLHNTGKYKIMVSGSTSSLLIEEISRELRGRYISKILLPFSFREYLRMKGINVDDKNDAFIMGALRDYMEFGGYPEVIKISESIEKKEKLRSIYYTTLYRDIIERARIKERDIMEFMLRYLISNSGNTMSISKLHKIISSSFYPVSKRTVWKYYSLILSSFAVFDIKIHTQSRKKEMLSPQKIYAVDNGLYNIVSTKKNMGSSMETLVFLHLYMEKNRRNVEIRYYKSKNQEVDFLILNNGLVEELIQVCYDIMDPTTKKREIDALIQASKELKCNNLKIITWDYEGEEIVDNKKIKYVPLWRWLL